MTTVTYPPVKAAVPNRHDGTPDGTGSNAVWAAQVLTRVRTSTAGCSAAWLRQCSHWRFWLVNAVCGLLPTFWSAWIRADLYRRVGFAIGRGTAIMGNLRLVGTPPSFYENLVVGAGAEIADSVTINLDELVSLGDNVSLGPGVMIYTASHLIGPGSHRMGKFSALPVTVEKGAWVRLGAVIAPGVTIGAGSIVAAGAVVLHDVPPNTYVEGNPAKVIRKLGWADR